MIPSFITEYFGNNYVKITADEVIYKCPYCINIVGKEDKKGHLYVNMTNKFYFCHRCGSKGAVEYDEISAPAKNLNIDYLSNSTVKEKYVVKYDYYVPSLYPKINSENAYNYLLERGVSEKLQDFYDIRIGDLFGGMFGRIIIPNIVLHGNYTDMYVGRTYIGHPKKYKNPLDSPKSKIVFNLHRINESEPLIITEGVFSAIAAGKNAVAVYGKYVSEHQLKLLLKNYPKVIYVSLDSDAYMESIDLCNKIKDNSSIEVRLVELPDDKDPADLGHEAFMEYVENSKPYDKLTFLLRNIHTKNRRGAMKK